MVQYGGKKMKIKAGLVLRNVASSYVVVPVGKEAVDFNGMITLNETGAFLWEKMTDGCTEEDLVNALLEEYDVSLEQAKDSVSHLVKEVKENNFVEE